MFGRFSDKRRRAEDTIPPPAESLPKVLHREDKDEARRLDSDLGIAELATKTVEAARKVNQMALD